MADEQPGLLQGPGPEGGKQVGNFLGGPTGLLGALSNPETMGYLAMMVKGLNPYSTVDPTAMLKIAQEKATEQARLAQSKFQHEQDLAVRQAAQQTSAGHSRQPAS